MGDRIASLGPVPGVSLLTPSKLREAQEGQAKLTGSASNHALQSDLQARRLEEERWRQGVAREQRRGKDMLAGLQRVEMAQKRQDNGASSRSPLTPPKPGKNARARKRR